MARAVKEKVFNIMRAHKFADISYILLELVFKSPLYQQVKFHTFLAIRQAFTWYVFLFPVSRTIPCLEVLVLALRRSEISMVTNGLIMRSGQGFSSLTLTTGLYTLHPFLLPFSLCPVI